MSNDTVPIEKTEMLNKYAMLKYEVKMFEVLYKIYFSPDRYSKLNVSNVWSVYYKISLYLW